MRFGILKGCGLDEPKNIPMCDDHWAYVRHIKSKFFRVGVNTHLDINMDEREDRPGELIVNWSFTFQELGSTHRIARVPAVVVVDPISGTLSVDGVAQSNIQQAESTIFEGFYTDYVSNLFVEEGISNGS